MVYWLHIGLLIEFVGLLLLLVYKTYCHFMFTEHLSRWMNLFCCNNNHHEVRSKMKELGRLYNIFSTHVMNHLEKILLIHSLNSKVRNLMQNIQSVRINYMHNFTGILKLYRWNPLSSHELFQSRNKRSLLRERVSLSLKRFTSLI